MSIIVVGLVFADGFGLSLGGGLGLRSGGFEGFTAGDGSVDVEASLGAGCGLGGVGLTGGTTPSFFPSLVGEGVAGLSAGLVSSVLTTEGEDLGAAFGCRAVYHRTQATFITAIHNTNLQVK